MGELLPCLFTGEHLWGGLGDHQSSGVGWDGGRSFVSFLPSLYISLDLSFFWFWYSHCLFVQAAIVAGIESGWVNPVINKEYAMEEVLVNQFYHFLLLIIRRKKCSTILGSCTKFTTFCHISTSNFYRPSKCTTTSSTRRGPRESWSSGWLRSRRKSRLHLWRRNQSKNFGGKISSVT